MSRRYAKMSENRLREGAEAIEKAWMVDSKDKEEPEAVNSSA
jgi:hypothetical protein